MEFLRRRQVSSATQCLSNLQTLFRFPPLSCLWLLLQRKASFPGPGSSENPLHPAVCAPVPFDLDKLLPSLCVCWPWHLWRSEAIYSVDCLSGWFVWCFLMIIFRFQLCVCMPVCARMYMCVTDDNKKPLGKVASMKQFPWCLLSIYVGMPRHYKNSCFSIFPTNFSIYWFSYILYSQCSTFSTCVGLQSMWRSHADFIYPTQAFLALDSHFRDRV